MTSFKLRPYQQETIDAVFDAWSGGMKRPAVVLPTGAGKTVIFSALVGEWVRQVTDGPWQEHGRRVIILVHRDELADQAISKLRGTLPDNVTVGKVKASDNEVHADVMVCSVQTISRGKRLQEIKDCEDDVGRQVGLIITDECHHGAAASYKKIYAEFPDAMNVGFTATMARGDGVGLGSTWDGVVYQRSTLSMIAGGYLTDVRGETIDVEGLDLSQVAVSRGDFQSGALGEALEESGLAAVLPGIYKEKAGDRQGIIFTPTVATAHLLGDSMSRSGMPTAVVTGETSKEERREIFEGFRLGKYQNLANCMVLTEGFDAPWASCAVIARPTRSSPLYVQMVGRVLRPWKDKKDALVLDLSGGGGKLSTLIDLEPGSVTSIKPGESLEEAAERCQTEAGQPVLGGFKARSMDLFSASHQAWLQTRAGVMFISAGEWTFFLWASKEQAGQWDVCRAPKHGAWEKLRKGLPVEMAMAWAEAYAEDTGSFSTHKSASWRGRKPSDAQVSTASRLGISVSEDMKKGEVSDALSVAITSSKFDPYVGHV